MALYTVFYLTAFHWLEVNVTVPAIWVHCQLDDVIPFCKYAIVPYFACDQEEYPEEGCITARRTRLSFAAV